MSHRSLSIVVFLGAFLAPLVALAQPLSQLRPLNLEIPTSSQMLPKGPGVDIVNTDCLICHSADHLMNQPSLTQEGWSEVVHKMIVAYHAPVSDRDAKTIVAYLTQLKGKK